MKTYSVPLIHAIEISESVEMEGELRVSASLLLKGGFAGRIHSESHVSLGPSSIAEPCTIEAASVTLMGRFSGRVRTTSFIHVRRKASVSAELSAPSISIAESASFEGRLST